jgi:capsular polysaccharide biosynthesis protein
VNDDARRVYQNPMSTLPRVNGLGPPQGLLADDSIASIENTYADLGAGLVSLAHIRAAIRRSARIWCAIAIAGLLAGVASFVVRPAGYQATTSVWLTSGPYENSATASTDDQLVVQSRTVAGIALKKLHLAQDVGSFLANITAVALSPRVLQITVSAPTGAAAVSRATAVAAAFLQFRKHQLRGEANLVIQATRQEISQAKQQLASIKSQISSLRTQPTSAQQQAQLNNLRAAESQLVSELSSSQQSADTAPISTATTLAIKGSMVLDSAALGKHSRLKPLVLHAAIGLAAGLALSLGVVVVLAIISDRLRRREDVARVLGAPVELSVPTISLSRWRPSRRGLAASGSKDVSRLVAYLGKAVARSRRGLASLAAVPVDEVELVAICLTSLAISCAQQGLRVVLADLCDGAPAARLLRVREVGVQDVRVEDARLIVAVPAADVIYAAGPLGSSSHGADADDEVAAACSSADLLLTLAALDPSVGGDYLAGWTSSVVAFVTAGRSSAERINSVGEMIRLARIPRVSAVLVGADKTDETLGTKHVPSAEYQPDGV